MSKLDALIKEINKNAKYEMMRAGGASADEPERLPTGIFQLDLALGGGVPVGRISVIYGTEASMKTTICLKLVAQAQRKWPEKKCVFFDVEGHFSRAWATQLGVDVDALVYAMPSNAEQLVDTVEAVTYADDVSVIVVDSLAALVTAHELGSSSEKAMVGTQGLLINKLYRKLGRAVSMSVHDGKTPTVLLINQIRFKVGVLMGDPETMPGGPSFKFASSLTLRLYGKDEMDKDVHPTLPVFKKISAIIKKWKVPVVARNCEFRVALVANEKAGLAVGQSDDVSTAMHYLKSLGMLVKPEKEWVVLTPDGEVLVQCKLQSEIEARLATDPEFQAAVREAIVGVMMSKEHLLDPA